MLDWLRRALGESEDTQNLIYSLENERISLLGQIDELTQLLAREEAYSAYVDDESDQHVKVIRDQDVQLAILRRVVAELLEPAAPGQGCTKVRLYTRRDAEAYARIVERESAAGALKAYKCEVCPRYPLTLSRYWHIGHVESGELSGASGRRWRNERLRKGHGWGASLVLRERLLPGQRERLEDLGKKLA